VPAKCTVKTSSYRWHIKDLSMDKFEFYEQSHSGDDVRGVLGLRSERFFLSFRDVDGRIVKEDVFLFLYFRHNKNKDKTDKSAAMSQFFTLVLCSSFNDASQCKHYGCSNMCFAWIFDKKRRCNPKMKAGTTPRHLFFTSELMRCTELIDESRGTTWVDEVSVVCEVHALNNTIFCVDNWLFYPLEDTVVQKSKHVCPLVSDLKKMHDTGQNSDVTLVAADGREFLAHVAILSSRSPVFAAMFQHDMEEKRLNQVQMDDFSSEAVECLLNFMYTDNISDIAVLPELLAAADKYNISRLLPLCEETMMANLNTENAAECFSLADRHNASQLRKEAKRFTARHLKNIKPREGWKKWMDENQQLAAEILDEMAELMAELTK